MKRELQGLRVQKVLSVVGAKASITRPTTAIAGLVRPGSALLCVALVVSGCSPGNSEEATEVAYAVSTGTTSPGFGSGTFRGVITAGNVHTCALVDGGVFCWGGNVDGQLGNGSNVTSIPPSAVSTLSAGVQAIAAGGAHTCAIVNGSAKCWGDNSQGQLGNATQDSPQPGDSNVPVSVTGLGSGVQAISGGDLHTCAIANGAAKCWGNNDAGRLGNGDPQNRGSSAPVAVANLTSGVQAIAAGGAHTCAIVNGGVRCWGSNSSGQLGNATQGNPAPGASNIPIQVTGLTGGVVAIAAGQLHTCALLNGGVQCWGDNRWGQLGIEVADANAVRSPGPVHGLTSGVVAIAAGQLHTCALLAGGAVKCWGANDFGQVGTGTPSPAPIPAATSVPGIASGATILVAGYRHSCVIANDGARCWGDNSRAQIGINPNLQPVITSPALIGVGLTGSTSGIQAISVGANWTSNTCAVRNGAAYCWGSNGTGQLGYNDTIESRVPGIVPGLEIGVTAIATGQGATCVLKDGGVQCWGNNQFGQLGNGSTSNSRTPVLVSGLTSGVAALSVSDQFACALKDGGVQCWGYNGDGQLGNGTLAESHVPAPVSGLGSGVSAISTGDRHACALVNGTMKCWGANFWGQLGNNSTTASLVPVEVTGLGAGVLAIGAGGGHSCAFIDGAIRCWGDNSWGQLGNNTTVNSSIPVAVSGLSVGVQAIAVGYIHSCAIQNGGVWCWGDGASGQLGNGMSQGSRVPVAVSGLSSGVQIVAAGYQHSCALTQNGIRCWGSNQSGELGNNSKFNANIQVPLFWTDSACADGSVEQNFGDGMVGCAGAQTFSNRATLCGSGYRLATASEWVMLRRGLSPTHDYWTNDALLANGTASGSCFGAMTGGASCGASPVRVCTNSGTDAEGNTCSMTHCGLNTAMPDQFLGGCTSNSTAGALCVPSGGCSDGSAEQIFENGIVGCAGAVTFPNRATLCAPGYRTVTALEWYRSLNVGAPQHHYWTDDLLKFSGIGSSNCTVSVTTGTDCGATTPMRVCTATNTDPENNFCNWIHCGADWGGQSFDRYFGGCAGNTTAGTLCMPNQVPGVHQ